MAYELFHNKAAKFSSPQVTIRSGKIAFNADAGDILAKLGMRFAHLLWDSDACKVAIRPTIKEDDNAFKISIPQGKRGGLIAAQSFLNYIHWRAIEPVVIDAIWNEAECLLEVAVPSEHVDSSDKERDKARKISGRLGRRSG